MFTAFRWDGDAGVGEFVPPDRLPPSAAGVTGGDVVWIDLSGATPEEEQLVFERFLPVHSLTLDDVTKLRREPDQGTHFPKVEEFPDYLFVVVNPLPHGLAEYVHGRGKNGTTPENDTTSPPGARPAPLHRRHRPQLSVVLTHQVLITHHYQPLDCVSEVLGHLERNSSTARRGPDYIFHLILDAMVDAYAPVVDRVAAQLDALENRVFSDPSPDVLARILRMKRLVTGLRKTLILEREVLARLTRGEFELVDDREIAYYRNVYDHVVRYAELIESAREMVSDLMQTHLAAASNRLNQVMKLLTMISTVVLPMTLIAGVYGMNFDASTWPPFHSPWGFGFAVGLMVCTGVAAFALFRWRRWL